MIRAITFHTISIRPPFAALQSKSGHHIVALSTATNYRLVDWLTVFGFHLDYIPRMMAALTVRRTTLLDSGVYDARATIEWFSEATRSLVPPPIAPASRLLIRGPNVRIETLCPEPSSSFVYAKVGAEDAFAFPDLVPGSVIRADTRRADEALTPVADNASRPLFLIEHSKGFACCSIIRTVRNRILMRSLDFPFAQVELELERDVRILGAIDLELRPLVSAQDLGIAADLTEYWKPEPLGPPPPTLRLGQLLLKARSQAHLSLREASANSRRIADIMGDDSYFCAPGSLSDFESTTIAVRIYPKDLHSFAPSTRFDSKTFSQPWVAISPALA